MRQLATEWHASLVSLLRVLRFTEALEDRDLGQLADAMQVFLLHSLF